MERFRWAAILIEFRYAQIVPLVAKCGCKWSCVLLKYWHGGQKQFEVKRSFDNLVVGRSVLHQHVHICISGVNSLIASL